MTDVYHDRIRETGTGTNGAIALLGAVAQFAPFSRLTDGATCRYTVVDADGVKWGTFGGTKTGTSLSRDTTYESSGGVGVAVTFGAGTHQVFLTPDSTQFPTAGGAATPGGVNTNVQFNDSGAFGGDAGLTYNKTTDVLTAVGGFVGSLTGNVTGNVTGSAGSAAVATLANTVVVADAAADTTTWPLLAGSQTGNLPPLTDGGLTYNANTNALAATTFAGNLTGNVTGDLTGNVTGNVTGSAGTAAVATLANTVVVADAAADTTTFPLLAGSATGNLPALTDAGLSYNASTNVLTAGFFAGDGSALTGVPGGSASDYLSVLVNTEVAITTTATAQISKQHVCSGSTYTVTLPAAAGNGGKSLSFRITAGGVITLDGNGSETIDGSLTRMLWEGETVTLYCDGSNWFKRQRHAIGMTVRLSRSVDQSGISPLTWTKLLLNTHDGGFSALWDSSNNRATAVRPGKWLCTGSVYTSSTGGTFIYHTATKNGITNTGPQQPVQQSACLAGFGLANCALLWDMAVGDYVNLCVYGDVVSGSLTAGAAGAISLQITEIPEW